MSLATSSQGLGWKRKMIWRQTVTGKGQERPDTWCLHFHSVDMSLKTEGSYWVKSWVMEKFLLSVPTETGQRQERMLRKLQAQQPSFGKSPLKGSVSTNKPLELSASYSHTCYQEKAGKMVVAKTASSKHLSSKFDSFTTFNRCLTERGLLVYYI